MFILIIVSDGMVIKCVVKIDWKLNIHCFMIQLSENAVVYVDEVLFVWKSIPGTLKFSGTLIPPFEKAPLRPKNQWYSSCFLFS